MSKGFLAAGAAVAVAIASASGARAAMLSLSTHSSDETPASLLSATFEFEVSGSTLTLTVTNNTSAPNGYRMNEIFFNSGDTLTGLTLTAPPVGWNLHTNLSANGFGVFDWALIDGVGENPAAIMPGASTVFTFTMTGTAVASDFVSNFSTIPPGDEVMVAAAKFITGPGDDSAFGATNMPAPGCAALVGAAGMLMGMRRRR